jgi:hypothetical protein
MYFDINTDLREMSYNDGYVKATTLGSCPVADFVITGVELPATATTVLVTAIRNVGTQY